MFRGLFMQKREQQIRTHSELQISDELLNL